MSEKEGKNLGSIRVTSGEGLTVRLRCSVGPLSQASYFCVFERLQAAGSRVLICKALSWVTFKT